MNNTFHIEHVNIDESECKTLVTDDDFIIRSIWHQRCTAYLVILKNKVGKLLIEKCKELNIPPGKELTSLKNNKTVEINGQIIRPADVLGPPEIGPAFAILECHSAENLNDVISKFENFSQYTMDKKLELIIHLTPKEITDQSTYRQWIKQFDPTVQHLFLNSNNQFELGFINSTKLQIQLNHIDNHMFKLLKEKQLSYNGQDNTNLIEHCPNLLTVQFRPVTKPDCRIKLLESNCCETNTEEIFEKINEENFITRLKNYRENVEKEKIKNNLSDEENYPNILFLGTASSAPNKQRNSSAIMVNFNEKQSMLFDCGEGTFIQMKRYFGRDQVDQSLETICAIFISHYHADHHFGLIKLILERSKLSSKPLWIIAPKCILSFLSMFDKIVQDLSLYYQAIDCAELIFDNARSNSDEMKQKLLKDVPLEQIVTVHVPHCIDSFGIVISYKGKKIAYSGDSMYSNSFDKAGQDCDLIIHEATMNDDLADLAKQKGHSTISQAINVGKKIGAKYTLLTHFSQRYAKIAPISLIKDDDTLSSYIQDRVAIAFDFMRVSFNDLSQAAKLKYPLETLFNDELKLIEEKSKQRTLKRKFVDEKS